MRQGERAAEVSGGASSPRRGCSGTIRRRSGAIPELADCLRREEERTAAWIRVHKRIEGLLCSGPISFDEVEHCKTRVRLPFGGKISDLAKKGDFRLFGTPAAGEQIAANEIGKRDRLSSQSVEELRGFAISSFSREHLREHDDGAGIRRSRADGEPRVLLGIAETTESERQRCDLQRVVARQS